MKGLAVLPGIIALVFVGHAFKDAGPTGATPYIWTTLISLPSGRSGTVMADANPEILHRPDGHRGVAFREPRSESFRDLRRQANHDQLRGAFRARPSDLR